MHDIFLSIKIVPQGIVVCHPDIHHWSQGDGRVAVQIDIVIVDHPYAKWIDVHNLHLSNAIALLHMNDKLIRYLEDGIDGGKTLGYVVENIVYVPLQ